MSCFFLQAMWYFTPPTLFWVCHQGLFSEFNSPSGDFKDNYWNWNAGVKIKKKKFFKRDKK